MIELATGTTAFAHGGAPLSRTIGAPGALHFTLPRTFSSKVVPLLLAFMVSPVTAKLIVKVPTAPVLLDEIEALPPL